MSNERDGTLEDFHAECHEAMDKIERLFEVSKDTAFLGWLLLSVNNRLIEQNDMLETAYEEQDLMLRDMAKRMKPDSDEPWRQG